MVKKVCGMLMVIAMAAGSAAYALVPPSVTDISTEAAQSVLDYAARHDIPLLKRLGVKDPGNLDNQTPAEVRAAVKRVQDGLAHAVIDPNLSAALRSGAVVNASQIRRSINAMNASYSIGYGKEAGLGHIAPLPDDNVLETARKAGEINRYGQQDQVECRNAISFKGVSGIVENTTDCGLAVSAQREMHKLAENVQRGLKDGRYVTCAQGFENQLRPLHPGASNAALAEMFGKLHTCFAFGTMCE